MTSNRGGSCKKIKRSWTCVKVESSRARASRERGLILQRKNSSSNKLDSKEPAPQGGVKVSRARKFGENGPLLP